MLCSILITTRKRPMRLVKLLRSIRDTADPDNYEVRIRIDEDDIPTKSILPELPAIIKNCHIRVGARGDGWASVAKFWDEIYKQSIGTWSWMLSDDMVIEGIGWDKLLAQVPTEGFIVHPEIHKLGGSTYKEDTNGPVPIVPKGALERFGFDGIPNPPDTGINDVFRRKSGWKLHYLRGIGVWHQRDDETFLTEERKS